MILCETMGSRTYDTPRYNYIYISHNCISLYSISNIVRYVLRNDPP